MRSWTSGSASARLISVLSMATIGAGTPAGAATPFQLDHHVVRQPAFVRGRNVLEHGIALVAGRRDDVELVRGDRALEAGEVVEAEIDLAAQQRGHEIGRGSVGDDRELRAADLLEQDCRQILRAARD